MPISTYTGDINILGEGGRLSDWAPRLTVRPEIEATGVWGNVSAKRRVIPLDTDGKFSMSLYPSPELTGTDGRSGVRYVLELALFDESIDGSVAPVRFDAWVFTAIDGGGNVQDMGSAPPNALIIGPPWPLKPRPGAYFDTTTGDLGYYGIGVV